MSWLPTDKEDIHPWMPFNLHDAAYGRRFSGAGDTDNTSQLGLMCRELGVSIHDREKVYNTTMAFKRIVARNEG